MSSTDGIGKSARDLDSGGKIRRGAARNGRLLRGRGKERCKGRWMNEYSWKSVVLRTPKSNDVGCVGLSVLAHARFHRDNACVGGKDARQSASIRQFE